MKMFARVLCLLSVVTTAAGAQGKPPSAADLEKKAIETKTIELHHLSPKEAVKLLTPYLKSTYGGVFDVSDDLAVVTLRDTPENIARMEQVLAKYDHVPATVQLVFELIEADTGLRQAGATISQISLSLDSTLRSVLKFPTYRLLGRSVATSGEESGVTQDLPTSDSAFAYHIEASVGAIKLREIATSVARGTRPAVTAEPQQSGTIHMNVYLSRSDRKAVSTGNGTSAMRTDRIMSTGLDVPLGHTVVLGTTSTGTSGAALILTVRPELVSVSGHE